MKDAATESASVQHVRPRAIALTGALGLAEAAALAHGKAVPELAETARTRAAEGHARLLACVASGTPVYGVTTGFGPLADRPIDAADACELQTNLINHLASGVGPPLSWAAARAVILARLNALLQGVSGASVPTIEMLVALIKSPYAPVIPERGTVGASGDLTPLAHAALSLMGHGRFIDEDGRDAAPDLVFAEIGHAPLSLDNRDGLALVNGTSAMTGIAVLNAEAARRAVSWGTALSAALAELLEGRTEAWDPAFAAVRPHPGQAAAAAELRARIAGSARVVAIAEQPGIEGRPLRPPQDAYTLRCVPQTIGAVLDTLSWHDRVVTIELNAATDNPIFPADGPTAALHGGNFMGQHVGLASDALATAVTVLAGLAERQVARLTDERLNGGLPAFLHRGPAGLNSGFMGAQVSATALLAEMRTNAVPASTQSISTNGANQDVVSMGTIAARKVQSQLAATARIQAILALAVAQAADILADRRQAGELSPTLDLLCGEVRRLAPPMHRDRPLSAEIEDMARHIETTDPPALVSAKGATPSDRECPA